MLKFKWLAKIKELGKWESNQVKMKPIFRLLICGGFSD